jgi:hypothetical protein
MEKVRLSLDELEVQSFATTTGEAQRRGTVRGHDAPTDEVECPTADYRWNTCFPTQCQGSCGCEASGDCSVDCWSNFGDSWDCSMSWCISWC